MRAYDTDRFNDMEHHNLFTVRCEARGSSHFLFFFILKWSLTKITQSDNSIQF